MGEAAGACCFAGPGRVPDKEVNRLAREIEAAVHGLAARGIVWFWAGGALGFDTLAAMTVLKMKEHMPALRLGLLLPGQDQADQWHAANRAVYNVIRSRADAVEYLAQGVGAQSAAGQARALAARSTVCVAWCPAGEPAPELAEQARREGLEMILL